MLPSYCVPVRLCPTQTTASNPAADLAVMSEDLPGPHAAGGSTSNPAVSAGGANTQSASSVSTTRGKATTRGRGGRGGRRGALASLSNYLDNAESKISNRSGGGRSGGRGGEMMDLAVLRTMDVSRMTERQQMALIMAQSEAEAAAARHAHKVAKRAAKKEALSRGEVLPVKPPKRDSNSDSESGTTSSSSFSFLSLFFFPSFFNLALCVCVYACVR